MGNLADELIIQEKHFCEQLHLLTYLFYLGHTISVV